MLLGFSLVRSHVMKDADLERAAQWIVDSRIGNNGQICNNAERVYVQKEVKAEFTKILVEKMYLVTHVTYLDTYDE